MFLILKNQLFDFDFYDIRQIEILRGPQGTLYGRNALGGIVNMYTLSPFEYQGSRLSATGGSYGLAKIRAAHYDMINEKIGWSVERILQSYGWILYEPI